MYEINDIVEIIGSSRYCNGPTSGLGFIIDINNYDGKTYFITPFGKDPKQHWFGYHEESITKPLRVKKLERIVNK